MRMYDLIEKKKAGLSLTASEIKWMIDAYTKGDIPDYQMSAMLMAICLKGMDFAETVCLTEAMRDSGDTVELSDFGGITVDKHSTGGVGDKTSLILAPIVSALGGKVAKMSGRGLGHTGGTVDKLESVKGFSTTLTPDEFYSQVKKIGVALVGQSGNLAPADKKLYALRDVTCTVQSVPLIASSIMSKKLAAGTDSIVLDVKYGSGAFMKTPEEACELARNMVEIGKSCGKNICAVISDMDTPLGNAIGNACEVVEAVEILSGKKQDSDLYTVSTTLAALMLSLSLGYSEEESVRQVHSCIKSGKAFEKFREWIKAQGGNTDFVTKPELLFSPKYKEEIFAEKDGYISQMDTEKIGKCAALLGAGREKKEDSIDYSAGIIIEKKTGDFVKKGELLATLYTSDKEKLSGARDVYLSAFGIEKAPVTRPPLIYEIIK